MKFVLLPAASCLIFIFSITPGTRAQKGLPFNPIIKLNQLSL